MQEQQKETTFELIIAILGVVSVELYFISPIIAIVKYKLGKCEINHIPFIQILCNLVNCASYIVSGITLDDNQQLICNLIGIVISAIYLIVLWTFFTLEQSSTNDNKNKGKKTETAIYLFMLFNVVFQAFYFLRGFLTVIKILSCIWNILMYAAGFIYVYEAYKSRKAEFVPWQGAICGIISTAMWICYTISLIYHGEENFYKYYPSLIANSVGFLVLIGILCSYFWFKKKFGDIEVQESNSLLSNSKQSEHSKTESIPDNDDDY